jgi:hypothetical protein
MISTCTAGIVDTEPRSLLIEQLYPRDLQIGREGAADARDLQALPGDEACQGALAGGRLQEDEQRRYERHDQRQQPAQHLRQDAQRAHQKACPRLT